MAMSLNAVGEHAGLVTILLTVHFSNHLLLFWRHPPKETSAGSLNVRP